MRRTGIASKGRAAYTHAVVRGPRRSDRLDPTESIGRIIGRADAQFGAQELSFVQLTNTGDTMPGDANVTPTLQHPREQAVRLSRVLTFH